MKNFFVGIQSYSEAFKILFSRKFWWFLLFPIITLLLLFVGGNLLISYTGDTLSGLVESQVQECVEGISCLEWMTSATNIVIKIILKIFYFFLFMAFGGYIILIIMSPVYSWLSERTEAHLTGKEYPFSLGQFCKDILRGVLIALRNMFIQTVLSLIFLFVSFIPVIGLIVPFAIFFTSAYFYGFSFVDYAVERKRMNLKQSVKYIHKNKGLVTGIGTVFAFALLIPGISIVVCCFVSLLSVIASNVALNRIDLINRCKDSCIVENNM